MSSCPRREAFTPLRGRFLTGLLLFRTHRARHQDSTRNRGEQHQDEGEDERNAQRTDGGRAAENQHEVIHAEVDDTNGSGHGALAGFLMQHGVDTLICGGIGGGAQAALAEAGIKLYGGVSGDADAAVNALLSGNLDYDPNVHCDHHDHEHGEDGHTCGDHGCGKHSCH